MIKKIIFLALILPLAGCLHNQNLTQNEPPKVNGCEYESAVYRYGEIFPASDGCNSCTCANDGSISCTDQACNPAQCQQNSDCQAQGVDTSFCENGNWQCVEGNCEFSCDISNLL